MTDWKEKYFNDFIKLNRGFDLPNDKLITGDFPVVTSTEIKSFHKDFKVKGPGVVTGRSGSLGTVQYIEKNYWPHNTTLYVKDFKGNDPKFVYFFLQTMHLENFNAGAGVPTLNQNHLHKQKIIVPNLATQQRIASILSAYDDLIEVNNQRIKLLELTAIELYKEWFARMRFPGYEKVKTVRGVPEGWELKKLGDVIEVTSSKRIFLSDYVKEGVPFYRGKEISLKSNNESLSELLYISAIKFREIKKKFGAPKAGDILITAVGTIGNIYLVNDSDGDFYFKDGNLIWIRNCEDYSLSMYLYFYFINDIFINALSSITIGSSQEALTIAAIKKIGIVIPYKELISKFYQIANPIKSQMETLQQQNTYLRQIRDILLPRLMCGKLKVKSSETLMEQRLQLS